MSEPKIGIVQEEGKEIESEVGPFLQMINYQIAEGFIDVEEDEDGQLRLFPAKNHDDVAVSQVPLEE